MQSPHAHMHAHTHNWQKHKQWQSSGQPRSVNCWFSTQGVARIKVQISSVRTRSSEEFFIFVRHTCPHSWFLFLLESFLAPGNARIVWWQLESWIVTTEMHNCTFLQVKPANILLAWSLQTSKTFCQEKLQFQPNCAAILTCVSTTASQQLKSPPATTQASQPQSLPWSMTFPAQNKEKQKWWQTWHKKPWPYNWTHTIWVILPWCGLVCLLF